MRIKWLKYSEVSDKLLNSFKPIVLKKGDFAKGPSDGYRPDDATLMRQIKNARAGKDVECPPCGRKLPLWALYRCVYCGTWFCQSCAEKHFGKSRGEYNKAHFKDQMVERQSDV